MFKCLNVQIKENKYIDLDILMNYWMNIKWKYNQSKN